MPNITINNATIRHNRTVFNERSGEAFNRVHVSGDLTKTLAKQLDCEKAYAADGEWQTMKLAGEMRLVKFTITPKEGLETQEIAFDASEANSFKLKHQEGRAIMLSFTVVTPSKIAGVVDEYLHIVGYAPAKCVLSTAKGEQGLFTQTEEE